MSFIKKKEISCTHVRGFGVTLFTESQSEIIQLLPDSTFCDISLKK